MLSFDVNVLQFCNLINTVVAHSLLESFVPGVSTPLQHALVQVTDAYFLASFNGKACYQNESVVAIRECDSGVRLARMVDTALQFVQPRSLAIQESTNVWNRHNANVFYSGVMAFNANIFAKIYL